jgi:alpha-D-ribose 1-methylphosphonate 5-triphosphate synthase subunit PhnH
MLAAHVKNNIDDAKSALRITLRAVAKPGLAIEL